MRSGVHLQRLSPLRMHYNLGSSGSDMSQPQHKSLAESQTSAALGHLHGLICESKQCGKCVLSRCRRGWLPLHCGGGLLVLRAVSGGRRQASGRPAGAGTGPALLTAAWDEHMRPSQVSSRRRIQQHGLRAMNMDILPHPAEGQCQPHAHLQIAAPGRRLPLPGPARPTSPQSMPPQR